MDKIKISAKVLGQTALEDFCPRCYWVKLKTSRLPWQIFPGIFSSIDAYTKRCAHVLVDREREIESSGKRPFSESWLKHLGQIKAYHKTPHWSKFKKEYPEFGITLNGAADDIFELVDRTFVIPDYKTAKYTPNQDKLAPMYRIQLNGYKEIAEACGFNPVSGLWLVYFEPDTDEIAAGIRSHNDGFSMALTAKPVRMEIDPDGIRAALKLTRDIYEMKFAPNKRDGCKDCEAMDAIADLL